MEILCIIFKGLIILSVNIGFGYIISRCFYLYLFYPRDIYFFGKYHFYFSPGLVFRKKNQLISYLHTKLEEYLDYAKKDYFHKNFLTEYEDRFYREVFNYLKRMIDIDWLPKMIKAKVKSLLSNIIWTLIYKITRTIIPKLLKDLRADQRIDELDLIIDVYKLRALFEEHFYRFMLSFNLFFFGIVGIINMIMFWILI